MRRPDGAQGIANAALLFGVSAVVFSFYFSVLYLYRNLTLDDAYIAYRYALNLAEGFGITWNRLAPPTEGYTSFLHVVLLAPFLRAGFDPLLTTRGVSLLCTVGIATLVGLMSRRTFDATRETALLVAVLYVSVSNHGYLTAVGLETLLFTFLTFLAFTLHIRFLEGESLRFLALECIVLLLAFLARPEGALLAAILLTLLLVERLRTRAEVRPAIGVAFALLLLPAAAYLVWKKEHFGSFLANPFYLKVGTQGLLSDRGLDSIKGYLGQEIKLALLAVSSLAIFRRGGFKPGHLNPCLLFVGTYTAFYAHVNTLMDVGFRFMHPVTPFLYFLSLPLTVRLLRGLLGSFGPAWIRLPVAFGILLGVFSYSSPLEVYRSLNEAVRGADLIPSDSLMAKRYAVARQLAGYPGIADVSIAYGDSGVIPYFTRSDFLDLGGLNDPVIARERDLRKLVDHVFSRQLTLVILPSEILAHAGGKRRWLVRGHGPLGNYNRWANDRRWNRYAYAGTLTAPLYELNFLVRRRHPRFQEFRKYIRDHVADVVYDRLEIPLGTRNFLVGNE